MPELLRDHTTLRLGGPARDWIEATTEREVVDAVRRLDAAREPVLVLAGGSNLVVADEGFDGTVVKVATSGIAADSDDPDDLACLGAVTVTVAAGENWDTLVARAVDAGWVGFVVSLVQLVPLYWRRHHPRLVFALVAAGSAAQAVVIDTPLWSQVAFPVAVYSVARYASAAASLSAEMSKPTVFTVSAKPCDRRTSAVSQTEVSPQLDSSSLTSTITPRSAPLRCSRSPAWKSAGAVGVSPSAVTDRTRSDASVLSIRATGVTTRPLEQPSIVPSPPG